MQGVIIMEDVLKNPQYFFISSPRSEAGRSVGAFKCLPVQQTEWPCRFAASAASAVGNYSEHL